MGEESLGLEGGVSPFERGKQGDAMSETPKKHRMIDQDECNTSGDPVRRMVRDLSPEAVTEWLIECHGLSDGSRWTVASNLREQFKWHRLQGRLDGSPFLALLAQTWVVRRSAKALETPARAEGGA